MNLEDRAETVSSREDLVVFIDGLADSLRDEPEVWENDTLERFLRAWSAWIEDMEGFFTGRNLQTPDTPSWSLVAEMLLAARVYE